MSNSTLHVCFHLEKLLVFRRPKVLHDVITELLSFLKSFLTVYYLPPPFPPSTLPVYPHLPLAFKFRSLFSLTIVIYTCVCSRIHKYNPLSPHNITCVNIFRAGQLVLANQLVCSPGEGFLLPRHSLVAYSPLSRVEASSTSPSVLACLLVSSLFS